MYRLSNEGCFKLGGVGEINNKRYKLRRDVADISKFYNEYVIEQRFN